jgi:hypothetical protein
MRSGVWEREGRGRLPMHAGGVAPYGTAAAPEDLAAMPSGSDGVCGFLTDGHAYPKTFGGRPKPVSASGRDG